MEDVEMVKEKSFKEGLSCPEVTKAQEELAIGRMKSEIFREMGNLDLKNNEIGPKLEQLVRTVGDQYNIADTSEILEMMIELLNSGGYLYKVNKEGYLISNYSKHDISQKEFHDRKNNEATEKLQGFVEKVQRVFEGLPDEKKYDIEAIQGEFSEDDWERNSIWIDLAIEKVLRLHQEDSKKEDISLEEH